MRERPLLMSDAMVRAILSGAKTQTRRPVKPQPDRIERATWSPDRFTIGDPRIGDSILAPWFVGDRLWVREAHAVTHHHAPDDYPHVFYRADGAAHQHDGRSIDPTPDSSAYRHAGRWTPSIHMPRWASRLALRVTNVRVERVKDITEEDARAEGFVREPCDCDQCETFGPGERSAGSSFAIAWKDTYGPDSWASNPWVWVVSFEREEVNCG